jgi:O-antigen ligase
VALTAAGFVHWPALVPFAVLVTAPLRPPLSFDSSSRFLVEIARDGRLGRLLPLYFVLAAAATALGWRTLRGGEVRALPRQIALPAAAFFAFACCSLLWADDVEAGTNLLLFFTLPFVALLATVARAEYPDWAPRWLAGVALAMGAIFAAVGLWQAATHELFFYAPNLAASNANTDYFRVTSLFGDPSLYGRHLVLGIGVALTLLATRRGRTWPLIGVVVLMWAGLLFSYSQSSMTALLVVTLALAVATGDARIRRGVALLTVAALLGACAYVAVQVADGKSLNRVTSDRTERVQDATRVIERHPFVGVGIGGQPRASRRIAHSDRPTPNFVSHTTPLTVFAELGVVGLVLYAWLLVGGAITIAHVRGRDEALGLALGATFLGLFVHALFYSGFLEDPLTWLVLGIAAAYCAVPAERRTRQEVAAA